MKISEHISWKNTDTYFWILFLILVGISVLACFASTTGLATQAFNHGKNPYGPVFSHALFLAAGIAVAFIVQFVPSRYIRVVGYMVLAISFISLILAYVPGFGVTRNGANRWVQIAGIQFQPSELAKLSLVIVIADLLSRAKTQEDKRKYFLISLGLTLGIVGLILPNNLSTAVLITLVVMILFFLARVPWQYLTILILAGVAVISVATMLIYFVYIKPNRLDELPKPLKRVPTWIGRFEGTQDMNTHGDTIIVTDDNLQEVYASVAVANGGKTPFGVLPGNSMMRNRLPLAYADYVYAIIVEETGIVGAIILIIIYLLVLFRACYASSKYSDYSALLMVMGLALMLTLQTFVSMEVAVAWGPVTGQPLPLISRGGTSIVITCLYFGIMMAVSREQKEAIAQEQAAVEDSYNDIPELKEE